MTCTRRQRSLQRRFRDAARISSRVRDAKCFISVWKKIQIVALRSFSPPLRMKRTRYCLNPQFFSRFDGFLLRQLLREILQMRLLVNRIVISVNKTLEFVMREDDVCNSSN